MAKTMAKAALPVQAKAALPVAAVPAASSLPDGALEYPKMVYHKTLATGPDALNGRVVQNADELFWLNQALPGWVDSPREALGYDTHPEAPADLPGVKG